MTKNLLLIVLLLISAPQITNAQQSSVNVSGSVSGTNNGISLIELELETPYPEDYDAIVAQADRENKTGYLPPLKTRIENIQDYDAIFVGFPAWDMQLPPPMKSFMNEYDLSGKTVIPFNTNGGYGVGSGFQDVEERCSDCNIQEGFSIKGGLERDGIYLDNKGDRREEIQGEVRQWLRQIKL